MKHVFGPVPSRRLGFSLGVDTVVPKTCTLDCVYCELGPTTDCTVTRRPYVDVDEVLEELRERLAERPKLDFVTLSGSGEPTLNSGIGALIEGVKSVTDKPVAVLTNGTLLTEKDVRKALLEADVVAPSLDAVSRAAFEKINRPHESLDPEEIAEAVAAFTASFSGRVWLEIVFVEGMNDGSGEIALLTECARRISPERVHINTVVRPPAVSRARPVDPGRLAEIAAMFGPTAEVIASPSNEAQSGEASDVIGVVVEMAARRPVTALDVAKAVGISQAAAAKMLNRLEETGVLSVVRHGQSLYYRK